MLIIKNWLSNAKLLCFCTYKNDTVGIYQLVCKGVQHTILSSKSKLKNIYYMV